MPNFWSLLPGWNLRRPARGAGVTRQSRVSRAAGGLTHQFRQLPAFLLLIDRRFLGVTGIVAWMAYQLLPGAWAAYSSSTERAVALGRSLAGASFEERRLEAYGDCGKMGYGYVASILHSYPRTDSLPLIRYDDYDRPLGLLLPGWRTNVDESVLIGIGISERDFQERLAAHAQRRQVSGENGTTLSRWTFQTVKDYQLMSRVELLFGPHPLAAARAIELTLIESPTRSNLLGSWSIQVPAGQSGPYSFVLPSPVRNFSKTRGTTDFILLVKETGESSLENIRVYGAKVDGAGFITVSRHETCFVAVQRELLSRVHSNPHDPWAHFIEAVRNVPLP